jgi:glutamine synthetase type III
MSDVAKGGFLESLEMILNPDVEMQNYAIIDLDGLKIDAILDGAEEVLSGYTINDLLKTTNCRALDDGNITSELIDPINKITLLDDLDNLESLSSVENAVYFIDTEEKLDYCKDNISDIKTGVSNSNLTKLEIACIYGTISDDSFEERENGYIYTISDKKIILYNFSKVVIYGVI